MHGWECLPSPCLLHVLRHATPADRRACRLVCTLWAPAASAAITTVHLCLPLPTTPPEALPAALDRALRPFPRASHLRLTLSGTLPPTPLAALLAALATAPPLARVPHLTLAAPALTTALPLLSLRPAAHLRSLALHAPHSPHLLARLAPSLPHLTTLTLDPAHLTTPPTNHTLAHLLPPLTRSLSALSLPLSTSTADAALLTLPPLTRLTSLTLACGRHFASPAGLLALTTLVRLRRFSSTHLVFHSIPSALALHPHRMDPRYAPPPAPSSPRAPTWPAALKAALAAWTRLECLHMSETDLDPLLLAALPAAPPSIRALTLDLRYTSQCPPPTKQQAAPLAACPTLRLVLEPHREHALRDYQPLLEACPKLHSLSLLGITLDAAALRALHAAPALCHLALHFHHATPHPLGPALLSAALLAPLASTPQLATLHISAPPHLAPCLAHLLHDPTLPVLLSDLPLRSLSLTTQPLAAARAAAQDATCLTKGLAHALPPGTAAESTTIDTDVTITVAKAASTVDAAAGNQSNGDGYAALGAEAAALATPAAPSTQARRRSTDALRSWVQGAAASMRAGLEGLLRAGGVQQVAVKLPDWQFHWAATG